MEFRASVSMEFGQDPPETVRILADCASWQTAAQRAVREARKLLPKRKPLSIVVVLERVA